MSLASQFVNLLAALLLLIAFAMLAQRRILTLIHLFAWQGVTLAVSTAIVAYTTGQTHLYISAVLTVALKVLFIPWALHWLIDRLNVRWDVETLIAIPTTMLIGIGLAIFAFSLFLGGSVGSFIIAVQKRTGRVQWKTDRPEAKSGHSTPIVWRGPDGKNQILLPGSFLLTAYDADSGRKLWWVGGLSFEMKSTPVIGGDTLYINGYGAPVNDPGNKVRIPAADEVWKTTDSDGNGVISRTEFPKFTGAFWFDVVDLDTNGSLTRDEWAYYRAALDSENGMLAIRLGGSGDMSDTAVRWKYQRSVPQLPSPLLYRGILYMVNDNGIVTTLDPDTGAVIKQGRLTGALGPHFASPVAADGYVFFTTEPGAVVVVAPGGDLTPTAVNDLAEEIYATPAFADGRIYIRTVAALYAFGVQ